ncbi:MAG TPA: alpha/beta hydrolase [Solirubrobacteraceae bacterium]|jgi:pimeloyl-ACP methyl ester carboxylesterase|nr:alpha/beta hydrolase [Solirubrobacteraceae bacterium]
MASVSCSGLTSGDGSTSGTKRAAWLDVDWREHQRWATVAGRPVNVVELGEGPPLVFVHGLAGSWQNWLEQLPVFAAAGRRVIAMDLPGFGDSPMPAERITISGYAAIIDELLGELGVDAAAVVGNSMGGFIGAELAIRFSTRVERLVLVSAAGITVEHQRGTYEFARRVARVLTAYGAWLSAHSDTVVRRPRLRRGVLRAVAADPSAIPPPLAAEQVRGSGKPGFIDALDALTSYPIRERLPEIACPTLIVWGDEDRLVPLRDADVFAQTIPRARKIVYRHTGHVAMLERPAEFNRDLAAFLAE